jgi:hypothetical protein
MNNRISQKTRKELNKVLGEDAANEIYSVLNGLLSECDNLRNNKLDSLFGSKKDDHQNRGNHERNNHREYNSRE